MGIAASTVSVSSSVEHGVDTQLVIEPRVMSKYAGEVSPAEPVRVLVEACTAGRNIRIDRSMQSNPIVFLV